jgi:hypothetical protein
VIWTAGLLNRVAIFEKRAMGKMHTGKAFIGRRKARAEETGGESV